MPFQGLERFLSLFYPALIQSKNPMSTRSETVFIALSSVDDRPRLHCVVRRWTDGSYRRRKSPPVSDCESNCEGYMNTTQLHLFKVVISQCLVTSEPLALMDED